MTNALVVLALGFFLGMRHATDADHVIAVTTIVTRQKKLFAAALTGLLWGVGHSLTVFVVGAAVILFNVTIPERVGLGMELSVGAMLIALGLVNVAAFRKYRTSTQPSDGSRDLAPHAHSHGDYVHTHAHGHNPDAHPHRSDATPVARLDRRFDGWRLYRGARPVVVGVVHGLAGSAAVTLLIVAAVPEPRWAVAYLLVFGLGTIAGMMLVTVSIASTMRLAGGRSARIGGRWSLAAGVVSVLFGLAYTYQVWAASGSL